ncbi:TetR/AcrR family transcriptional regulator [Williamsia sp. MIQD14]|uniref:TetR/AcrR family transcriptional regulator n=1 Tax=Williamsia sp. MIQD14 TaxID=3425703 RepID=UPI003DA12741
MATMEHRDARRAQIITGVRSVLRDQGIGNVTVARAADAAGVSVGMVQHYYRSKEDLLVDAFMAVRAGVLDRVDHQIVLSERRGSRIEDMLTEGLAQLLPLSPNRRDEVYLAHAFAGMALENDTIREHLESAREALRERVRTALENGRLCGEVDTDIDDSAAAFGIVALVEGVAAHLLGDPSPRARSFALAALSAEAARLCPGECHHGTEEW